MAELVMNVKAYRALGDEGIKGGNGCMESFEGEVVFVIQMDKKSLAMRINNKEVYRLEADVVKMLFEFIVRGGQPEIMPYPEGGYVLPSAEQVAEIAKKLNENI